MINTNDCSKQLEKLSLIACTQPHAAYSSFIHGFFNKLIFLFCITPDVSVINLFKSMDHALSDGEFPPNFLTHFLLPDFFFFAVTATLLTLLLLSSSAIYVNII